MVDNMEDKRNNNFNYGGITTIKKNWRKSACRQILYKKNEN